MATIPALSTSEVQDLAVKIGISSEWPESIIFTLLFDRGSGFSSFATLSERLASYTDSEKPLKQNYQSALVSLTMKVLQYFQREGILSDKEYDVEYSRCQKVLFPSKE